MTRSSRRLSLLFMSLALWAGAPGAAQPAGLTQEHLDRLVHLGRLWGTVRYLHPFLAYRDIDWDAALVQAIPRVQAAETAEQYSSAVQSLLAALGDPTTRVLPQGGGELPRAGGDTSGGSPVSFRWASEGVLAVDLRTALDSRDSPELRQGIAQVAAEIPKARAVILDLRGPAGRSYDGVLAALNGLLTSRPIRAPAQRYLLHSGYRPQSFPSSGGYFSAFVNLSEEVFQSAAGASHKRVVFVVRSGTVLPPVALALQAAGDGVVIAEGPLGDGDIVRTLDVDLGEGLKAAVRITEIVPFDGWPGVHADVEVAPTDHGATDAALQEALAAASGVTPAKGPNTPSFRPLPEAVWRPDKRYAEMLDPAFEYRLLAVFRFWNVIHYFYPHRELLGGWDQVLPEFIARMESASDGRDYALALAEMAARVQDGHTDLWGHPELSHLYGEAFIPIALRWIEGRYVVTAVRDDPAVQTSGIQVGDEVLAVDGQPLADRLAFFSRYVSASNPASLRAKVSPLLLGGSSGSTAVLTVRRRDGRNREVRVPRHGGLWNPEGSGEVVRVLPGNFGYMDLTRLTVDEVDAAFERLRGSRGIVFDMRGYPHFTAWAIAAHLNVRGVRVGALFRRPMVSGMTDDEDEPSLCFQQSLSVSKSPPYTGKTVMLIDERTISQGEHTGLLLEAVNGTRFVGAPTAGTNGDVTDLTLPGGIIVRFTGHDVRHADGRPMQRIGLLPDVPAAPTLAGLRAGRDEVLERALRDLESQTRKAPAVHHER